MVKKITMMQRSTGQRSTADSRHRLTSFKMLVSHSMSAVLRQSNYMYCQMLNQVFKVSSGTCQQFVEDAVKISNIFGFSTFTR